MTRAIDAYLSRRAQRIYPDAMVYREIPPGLVLHHERYATLVFTLTRGDGESITLGYDFREANHSLTALAHAERSTTRIHE